MIIKNIAVVGLGLIGGSILKSLKGQGYNLIGVSRSQSTVDKALEQGLVDFGSVNINILNSADLVFVCVPINKVIETVKSVAEQVSPECIITDAASIKGFIVESINESDKPINFIGGHPMAGTEHKGIDAAIDGLYRGAKWVIAPSKWSKDSDIIDLQRVLIKMGAKPVMAKAKDHDKAVAMISHMPMLVSQALYKIVAENDEVGDLALKLASSGFRDMTRLAMSNVEMASDMINFNRENVNRYFVELVREINFLSETFDYSNEDFAKNYEKLIYSRRKMYDNEGKNAL